MPWDTKTKREFHTSVVFHVWIFLMDGREDLDLCLTPKIWTVPMNNSSDCSFCITCTKTITIKTKSKLPYLMSHVCYPKEISMIW